MVFLLCKIHLGITQATSKTEQQPRLQRCLHHIFLTQNILNRSHKIVSKMQALNILDLDPDDQLIVECCRLNCASVVSLRRPSASRLTLLRTHRREINSNFIHDLLKANLKPNHIFRAMLLWSKLNPSRTVSKIAFELTFWGRSRDV